MFGCTVININGWWVRVPTIDQGYGPVIWWAAIGWPR